MNSTPPFAVGPIVKLSPIVGPFVRMIESSPTENILVAYLHYSNDYIAELEPSKTTKMNKLKKGTPDGIKTWLNIMGITLTCSGIISNNNSPMNEITKTGLIILFTNYIFDKILTII